MKPVARQYVFFSALHFPLGYKVLASKEKGELASNRKHSGQSDTESEDRKSVDL